MQQKFAYILSLILHPWWLPTYAVIRFLASGFTSNSYATMHLVVITTIACTMVVPMMAMLVLYSRQKIGNLTLPTKEERQVPYSIYTYCMSGYTLLLMFAIKDVPRQIQMLAVALTIQALLLSLINRWWKVSAHMCGWGTLLGAIIAISWYENCFSLPMMIATILATGVVGWARIECEAHTPLQLLVGYLIGFASSLILILLPFLQYMQIR